MSVGLSVIYQSVAFTNNTCIFNGTDEEFIYSPCWESPKTGQPPFYY